MGLSTLFYGGLTAVGAGVCLFTGRPWILVDPAVATPARLGLGALAGVLLGAAVVLLSRLSVRRLRAARELYGWFAGTLGPLTPGQSFRLAILSGVGEEVLFRAALQPLLGLWVTSAIFGLLHLPPRRRYLIWTASAFLLGLALGGLAIWSGSIAGSILAHALINALNLRLVSEIARADGPGGDAQGGLDG
jgi:membrane protease YdiL (CAAX protease family)